MKIGQPENYMSLIYKFPNCRCMISNGSKSWNHGQSFRRKNTIESSCQRVVGNIFPNENVAFCALLLHNSLQGPRVVWDVAFWLWARIIRQSNIGCISKLQANMEIKRLDVLVSKLQSNMGNLQVKNQHRFVVCSCELVVFWNIWILDITYHAQMSQDGPLRSSFFSIILKQQKQLLGMREVPPPYHLCVHHHWTEGELKLVNLRSCNGCEDLRGQVRHEFISFKKNNTKVWVSN